MKITSEHIDLWVDNRCNIGTASFSPVRVISVSRDTFDAVNARGTECKNFYSREANWVVVPTPNTPPSKRIKELILKKTGSYILDIADLAILDYLDEQAAKGK